MEIDEDDDDDDEEIRATPEQIAEILCRVEAVSNRPREEHEKSGAVWDASGIPEGTVIDFIPGAAMARCIRPDGKPLDDGEFEELLRAYGL